MFGNIENPLDTLSPGGYGGVDQSGAVFISNIVKLILVVGGIATLFIALFAGFTYITSAGDTKKLESAVSSINMALTGLVIMVAAVALTGVVSWFMFGDPTVILSPQIYGPGDF